MKAIRGSIPKPAEKPAATKRSRSKKNATAEKAVKNADRNDK